MGNVVVLGGSGAMGSKVVSELRRRGHRVSSASRANGVDVTSGDGLLEVMSGADCVVDCLNHMTMSRRRATSFFTTAAEHARRASAAADVGHLVCLSIVNATETEVRRSLGYYEAKALQEEVYARGPVPLTVVRTTAWFSLAETFLSQIRLGRLALVPRMRLQPVHPDAAAAEIVDAVEDGPNHPGAEVREVCGPEEIDADDMARRFAAATSARAKVVGLPMPLRGLRVGLLPHADVRIDPRRFADWLNHAS